jgi:carbonic anhydrase
MRRLLKGIHRFQTKVFNSQKDLFQRLAEGQNPEALFITCSDSRLLPNMMTNSKPGQLLILRNAANIIPTYDQLQGGEAATIEFALRVLHIKDIIICGHSRCGGINALAHPERTEALPALRKWLSLAEQTRQIILKNYADLDEEAFISTLTQENVLVQIENIKTHPAVADSLAKGELRLHAWVYKVETGEVFAFNAQHEQFLPIGNGADYTPIVG